MSYAYVMGLLGGLALFLYGIQMMSTALEAAAGNKMKVILEKLTTNRFLGVLLGALIQSSSASVGIYLLDIKHINTEKLGASIICMEGIKKRVDADDGNGSD